MSLPRWVTDPDLVELLRDSLVMDADPETGERLPRKRIRFRQGVGKAPKVSLDAPIYPEGRSLEDVQREIVRGVGMHRRDAGPLLIDVIREKATNPIAIYRIPSACVPEVDDAEESSSSVDTSAAIGMALRAMVDTMEVLRKDNSNQREENREVRESFRLHSEHMSSKVIELLRENAQNKAELLAIDRLQQAGVIGRMSGGDPVIDKLIDKGAPLLERWLQSSSGSGAVKAAAGAMGPAEAIASLKKITAERPRDLLPFQVELLELGNAMGAALQKIAAEDAKAAADKAAADKAAADKAAADKAAAEDGSSSSSSGTA